MTADQTEPDRGRPFLAYTRKYGWVVVLPLRPDEKGFSYTAGYSRPGGVRIDKRFVLAMHPLPAVPDEAL